MRTGYKTAGFTRDAIGTFNPDRLWIGEPESLRHEGGTVRIPDDTVLIRGCLMGRVLGVDDERAAPGNTGNTGFAVTVQSVYRQFRIGRYTLRCTTAGNAGAARYALYGPDREQIISALTSGAAKSSQGLSVEPTHGADNPVVGDTWSFRVYGVMWERVDPKSVTGSAIPAGILVQELDADDGNAITGDAGHRSIGGFIYTGGVFDWNAVDLATEGRAGLEEDVVYDHGYELADIRERLANDGLELRDTVQHRDDPSIDTTDRGQWL